MLARAVPALLTALVLAVLAAAPAHGAMPDAVPSVDYPGVQHLKYRFGPVKIIPGANSIELAGTDLKPKVPGYITRFEPNLERADGSIPPVDELHLHHAVWLMKNYPTFAAGEEKTIFQLPEGYGYKFDPSDPWIVNHMIHNLLPNEDKAYITYEIDFVPASTPAGQAMKEAKPLWLDVAGLNAYPVFDVKRQWGGKDGRYTFPKDARGAERAKVGGWRKHLADKPMTLLGTAGHLHPGGLYTDMFVRRQNTKKHVFRSEAKYWEPAGAVSWDVAMTATDKDWKVNVNPGDEISIQATYDTTRSSWYESMGIMITWYADGTDHGGADPFTQPIDTRGEITHGHLPENDNHGGGRLAGMPDARRLLSGTQTRTVPIKDFIYGRGDLSLGGKAGRPPVVKPGQRLNFRNDDSDDAPIYHTITACAEPCNRRTGIAYPLANGRRDFDSGELGFGPRGLTAAANRDTWQTPKDLKPGTYTYFCRVHPFMRGAFRVKGKGRSAKKR